VFDTESKAERYVEILRTNLIREEHTTETALAAYKVHLAGKGNKKSSIDVTAWAIQQFFPTALPLALLSETRCAKLYEELRTRPSPKTNKPFAADTHRRSARSNEELSRLVCRAPLVACKPVRGCEASDGVDRAASRSARADTRCA
jgi:hypothetical protein